MQQVACPDLGLTARVELVGQETTAVNGEDLAFFANLVMAVALSDRHEIRHAREQIAYAVQRILREQ